MSLIRTSLIAALALLGADLVAQRPSATALRHEVGRRLRAFEDELLEHQDAAARRRCVGPLQQAVQSFFSGRLGGVGRQLDLARRRLLEQSAEPAEMACEALWVVPASRAVDADSDSLPVLVHALYEVEDTPEDLTVRIALHNATGTVLGAPVDRRLGELPMELELSLTDAPAGDHELRWTVLRAGRSIAGGAVTLSIVDEFEQRVSDQEKVQGSAPRDFRDSLLDSARFQLRMLRTLARGGELETDVPAHALLADVEKMLACFGESKAWFRPDRPGRHWVRLATKAGLVTACLQVPENMDPFARAPLVIALHGAGGSENLFFDGYGNGLGPNLASERGWLFLAPRTSTRPSALIAAIDELANHYPVDRDRVFLFGHSMGAMHTARVFQTAPERFAALALLGGAGTVTDLEAWREVPCLVAVGEKDFARAASERFAQRLRRGGCEQVQYRELADVEHMAVVQLALPEVFAVFEEAGRAR